MSSYVVLAAAFLTLFGMPILADHHLPMFTAEKSRMTDNGKVKVYWAYNMSMDVVWFKVMAQTTGYVALGVAKSGSSGMMNYDIALGGVKSNGDKYLMDLMSKTTSRPPEDATKDLKLHNATEEGGNTTLMYYRKRDTGDTAGDLVITSMMDLKWAMHASSDDLTQHTMRGTFKDVNLVPGGGGGGDGDGDGDKKMEFSDSNMRSLDGGKFKYYWMVKGNEIWFKVMAKAKGWVAFGVTKEKSSAMVGFDVAVGGVTDGGVGYLMDYYTSGKKQPDSDAKQDVTMSMATEKDDYTTLVFHRKLNTGDSANDVEIKPGTMIVTWAYHASSDVTGGTFGGRHTMRGYDEVALMGSGAYIALPSTLFVICLAALQAMF